MREYRRATFQELIEASGSDNDVYYVESVQTLLESNGLTPVVVKNRKGQDVLSIKREWIQGDLAIKKYSWSQMVSEAFDAGRSLYEYYMGKIKGRKATPAEVRDAFQKAGNAKEHLNNIKPYIKGDI